jgi:glycosyltransferase involved in cell wall biosynthesis
VKLGFVIPWFGKDARGGAESECRWTALNLARRGATVEILTTCARGHAFEWVDDYDEGVYEEEGLVVRRFPVRPRDSRIFNELNHHIYRGHFLTREEEERFIQESIHSDALYDFIAAHREEYWFLFIPYLFGTTVSGAMVAPERSLVIPCLHDEGYAYLAPVRRMLTTVRGVLFHVEAERELALKITGSSGENFHVVGEGVHSEISGDGQRFARKYGVHDPFLLAVGRKDRLKNTHLLVEYFTTYHLTHPDFPLRLLLIGEGGVSIPRRLHGRILDLGVLPGQDVLDAYAAALALCQPSRLESFSLVLMEAWLCGTPVLVYEGCPVTREHCLASGGGLYFADYFEFQECVDLLLGDEGLRHRMAEGGRRYVLERFNWDRICQNYFDLLEKVSAGP